MAGVKGMKIKNRKPLSKETKEKISESLKKKWKNKAYRIQMCEAHKHELPKEWKENISKGMTGIKRSDDTKKKMSNYQSNRPKEVKQKQVNSWKKQWNTLSKEEQIERLKKLRHTQEAEFKKQMQTYKEYQTFLTNYKEETK